jgi:hypothetical protein
MGNSNTRNFLGEKGMNATTKKMMVPRCQQDMTHDRFIAVTNQVSEWILNGRGEWVTCYKMPALLGDLSEVDGALTCEVCDHSAELVEVQPCHDCNNLIDVDSFGEGPQHTTDCSHYRKAYPKNHFRGVGILSALESHYMWSSPESTAIAALTDLLHAADMLDEDFEKLLRLARQHYARQKKFPSRDHWTEYDI